jgi:glycosyltransferase involved in cell wall biosynthesis
VKFKEHVLAHKLLDRLQGLEIGAASHNPFGLKTRNVAPLDDYAFYSGAQEKMGESPARVDIWAQADVIPVPDDSEDFIISSHVLEHVPNVIATFWEWNRIVRVGGYIFMIVPLRNAHPEDRCRNITPLQHFLDDFHQQFTLDTHPTDGVPGGRMGHYHVFEPASIISIVEWMKAQKLCSWNLVAREDTDSKVGNGFTLVFQVATKSELRSKGTPVCDSSRYSSEPLKELRELLASGPNHFPVASNPSTQRSRIGLCGTFEVDNYGDLLFPAIWERMLGRHIPGLETVLFSPSSGVYKFNGAEIHAITELESIGNTLEGFVLGGGDVIRFDTPPAFNPSEMHFPPYAQLAILPGLLAGMSGKPLVWNAPGIPHALTPAQRMIVEGIMSVSTYVTVRDDQSKDHLGAKDEQINIVPNTGFLLADVFAKQQLVPLHEKLKQRYSLAERYAIVHVSPATSNLGPEPAARVRELAEVLPLLLLPLGPVHGEIGVLASFRDQLPDNCRIVSDSLHPLEIAALIAHGQCFVGSSLHGNITAFAYGIPSLAINNKGLAKLDQFGKLTGRQVLKGWDQVVTACRDLIGAGDRVCQEEVNRKKDIQERLLKHFQGVSHALGKPGRRSQDGILKLIRGLISFEQEKKTATEDGSSLSALKKALAENNRVIAVQQQIIDEKQATIQDLTFLIQTEKNSTGGLALESLRSFRDFLFPMGTWRRRGFGAVRRIARLMLSNSFAGRLRGEIGRRLRKRRAEVWNARLRAKIELELGRLGYQPLISVITPIYNVAEPWLRSAIESVRTQVYSNWELCLVNDASTSEWIRPILDHYAAADSRIRVRHLEANKGIAGASNHALRLATGEFVGLLDHDDELTPDALFEIVKRLNEDSALDLLYSDEDKIQEEGIETDHFFKPGWNPSLLLSCNYITHFSVFRRSLLETIGGFAQGLDGSQDYDLLLRFTEVTQRIAHIPKILYHWRAIRGSAAASANAKPFAYTAARKAIGEAVRRRGGDAKVESVSPGIYRVCYVVPDAPHVSILIHPPGKVDCLEQCLTSLAQNTNYPNCEVIVLTEENSGTSKELSSGLRPCVEKRFPSGLSLGEAVNLGVQEAKGDYLLFLSPELQILRADWLAALLEQAQRKEVGAVGAKLLGADGRLWHSGMVLGPRGLLPRWEENLAADSIHRVVYTQVVRDCSAVSADCLMVAKRKFQDLNGFDGRFRSNYHDIDFCLRLGRKGYSTVYTPHAALQFIFPKSRKQTHWLEDERLFRRIWGNHLQARDPYFHPNLTKRLRRAG